MFPSVPDARFVTLASQGSIDMFRGFRFDNIEDAERIKQKVCNGASASDAILRELARYESLKQNYPFRQGR